jgi:hypothetical protein
MVKIGEICLSELIRGHDFFLKKKEGENMVAHHM